MQLRYDHTLGSVNHKGAFGRHIRNIPQIYVFNHRVEILVFGIRTIQLQFGLQRSSVSQSLLQTFVYRITGRVDEVVQKFQNKIVPGVGDWEVLLENSIQAFVLSVFRRRTQLKKVLERL